MAKVFVDSNILFDLTERDLKKRDQIEGDQVFVSALSYHILFYTYKYSVPTKVVLMHKREFSVVGLTDKILTKAMHGPTKDLEDNIQLHSATKAECDYFLTSDKNLLKLRSFKGVKISSRV